MRTILCCALMLTCATFSAVSQNVFNPADTIARYDATKPLGSRTNPNPTRAGMQKWVSVPTNGISTSWDASSYKAYYLYVGGRRLPFRLKFPNSYTNPDSATKRYPVMLFFHGAGEPGCLTNGGVYNNEKQLLHGGKTFMDRVDRNEFDGFLFYPQAYVANCSNYWGTAYDAAIIAALDSMVKYIRADIDRLFVNGLSDGGRTTWRFARTFPTRVARVAPSAMSAETTALSSMIHIPVWFASGGRDTNPSPAMAQQTLTTFTNLGGNIRYTVYPTLGHGVWNQHWGEPDYVPYMNGTHKANPLVYFNHYLWCQNQTISCRMGLSPNFASYEWERNGQVIARRENGVNTILVATHVTSFTGNEITVRSLGTYRARFRRTSTGAWSAWSPQPAVVGIKGVTTTAPITVKGLQSKILPSPDGKTTVTLQLPKGFLNYQWYRSTDLTLLSNVDTFNAPAGTYRARYSEQFGCSTIFSPNFVVPSTAATPKPDPASNLTAVPLSERSNELTWQNNPAPAINETGFEIYRSTTSGGPYTLLAIGGRDTLTYQDNNLAQNTAYFYLVRAVTETAAAAPSNEAASRTIKDVQAPTAPLRLEYRGSNQYSVALRWNSSQDNVGVRRYDIYVNNTKLYSTTSTSYTVRNLDSLTTYAFTVRAVDGAGNASAPSAQLVAYTHRQGLNYKYVHGTFSNLPDFNAMAAVKQGVVDSVNQGTKIRTQADNYAILWTGYVFVPESSTYTFETVSDEGSKLWIDQNYTAGATPLVNNDGLHTSASATGEITLSRGYHQIAVAYFERTGTEVMELYWSNTTGNFNRRRIADLYFSHVNVAGSTPLIAPSALTATPVDFKSIKLEWVDNSPNETGFEVSRSLTSDGTYTPVGTLPANSTSLTNGSLNSSTTYFYKVRAVGVENESPSSDVQSATTPAAPGTPLAPTDLAADNVSPSLISLSWRNNSTNETKVQLYKSTDNVNFTLLTELPARANSYTDNAVTAFAQYYYYVMGVNANGNGERSEVLPVIAGNNAPGITAVNNMFVKTDATLSQDFSVSDPGDNVTVTIPNKPSFVTLQSLGGQNYRINVAPTVDNIGWHNLAVSVKDSKNAVTLDSFKVSVADKNVRSVYINVGNVAEVAPAPWNNWGGIRAAGSVLSSLRDETGAVTPFSITAVNAWARLTELGHLSGNNTGVVPDSVLRSGIADSVSTARQIMFGGLNPAMRYNIVFVGSQNEGINATTEYSIGTQRDTLRTTYNTQQTANLNTLTPDASGQILVNIRRLAFMSYLNGIVLEEYAPAITLLNPVNLYAEAVNRTTIDVSWSDRTNNEGAADGYELTRATDSLFANVEAVIALRGNVTTYRNTGLTPNRKYWYRVRAKSGATFSAYSNRAKTITPANLVLVNFNVSVTNAPSPWNNLETSPDEFETFNNLINQNLQVSGISMRLEQPFNGEFNAGQTTGNNSGVVPDAVLQANYWIDKTQLAQYRVTGLNATRRYRFGFVGSSSPNGWFKDNYTATYSINGRTVYLNSWTNTSKVVWIGDVVPDEDGAVLLNFSTTQAALYAFNAGVLIGDYTDAQGGSALNSVVEEPAAAIEEAVKGRIYPNPFSDAFNVDIYNSSAGNKISTEVYDVAGRLLQFRQHTNVAPGNNTLRVDQAATLKPGVYIVMVKVNGEIVQSSKLIKVRK